MGTLTFLTAACGSARVLDPDRHLVSVTVLSLLDGQRTGGRPLTLRCTGSLIGEG